MVVVHLLDCFLDICDHEGIDGLEDGCPDDCVWVCVSYHSSFGDLEEDLVVVESLLHIVGSRDTIIAPYRHGR